MDFFFPACAVNSCEIAIPVSAHGLLWNGICLWILWRGYEGQLGLGSCCDESSAGEQGHCDWQTERQDSGWHKMEGHFNLWFFMYLVCMKHTLPINQWICGHQFIYVRASRYFDTQRENHQSFDRLLPEAVWSTFSSFPRRHIWTQNTHQRVTVIW